MVIRSLIDFHFFEALTGAFEVQFFSRLCTISQTRVATAVFFTAETLLVFSKINIDICRRF